MSSSNGYQIINKKLKNGHSTNCPPNIIDSCPDEEVNEKYLKCLEEPYSYSTQMPGKAVRDQTIEAMNAWLNVEGSVLNKIKELIKILHESSLLIDDIQDNSQMRRGQPAAYLIFGISEVINIANLKYFEASKIALELGSMLHPKTADTSEPSRIFHEWMIKLHQGQGLDIYWRDHHICPTVEEYVDMVLKKTGGLMMLAFDLMYIFRREHVNQGISLPDAATGHHFLETFSKFFQIRDDYCNLWDVQYAANKSFCEDLTEGKFSWVIVQGVLKEKELGTTQVLSILKQRTTSHSIKQHCCKFLESLNVKSETHQYLKELEEDLRNQIESYGGNPLFLKIVDLLSADRINTVS